MKVSLIIPSRLAPLDRTQPDGTWFVERAVAAIRRQTLFRRPGWTPAIIVGVDPGKAATARTRLPPEVLVVEGDAPSQAQALNAAIRRVDGGVVAFLEDDDLCCDEYLELAVGQFHQCGFVSSTQLEVTVAGEVVRINDYPIPSTWVMPRATLDAVGEFDASFRWHQDSDWLGRLNQRAIPRIHFVEATAPLELHEMRTWRTRLADVVYDSHEGLALLRHSSPWPLVRRTRHPDSGMSRIRSDTVLAVASRAECERLAGLYGWVPA